STSPCGDRAPRAARRRTRDTETTPSNDGSSSSVYDPVVSNRKAIYVSAVAALGGFLFGFDTAVINGAVDAIQQHFALSSTATGVAVACALVGSAIGAWLAGGIADRLGRVRVM